MLENHIHFLMEASSRRQFQNALRFLTAQIAIRIGRGVLWAKRAWSRVVHWGRDYLRAKKYIEANPIQARIFDHTDVFVIRGGVLLDQGFG